MPRLSMTKTYTGTFTTKEVSAPITATMTYNREKRGFMVYDSANTPILPKFFKNTGAMKSAGFYFKFAPKTVADTTTPEAVAA